MELEVFEYTDYRSYLKDHYHSKKQKHSGWSLETWARRLGLKSKSTLAMILKGQRHPGRPVVSSLIRYFEFTNDEAEYFSDLVEWVKCKDGGNLSTILQERLAQKRKSQKFEFIDLDEFSLISQWFFPVIRELFHVKQFQMDPHWISHQLNSQLSVYEVEQALRLLERVGIVERLARGKYRLMQRHLVTPSDISSEAIKRFHLQILERAKESVRSVPVDEREISGSTFVVRQEDLPKAKKMLKSLMEKFADGVESIGGDRVYHLEVCFFPLTRKKCG